MNATTLNKPKVTNPEDYNLVFAGLCDILKVRDEERAAKYLRRYGRPMNSLTNN